MKKLNAFLFILIALLFCVSAAEAQKNVSKQSALNFLMKTNRLIGHAHMAVKRGKVYNGDLAKSVKHERLAKKLFNKGNYHAAIVHSRRARLLAASAIKANKVKPTSDATITAAEEAEIGTPPSDEELDKELTTEQVTEIKDEDLIKQNNLDLEVK